MSGSFPLALCFSGFLHVVSCVSTLFHFMAEWYSTVWLCCILFIHSSIGEHLDFFYSLANISNAAVNIHIQVFVWTCFYFSWVYSQESILAGLYGNYRLDIPRNCQTCIPKWRHQFILEKNLFFYFIKIHIFEKLLFAEGEVKP